MGCGSSSLKGDEPTGVTEEAPQPIKKVQTNFSTVDYDAAGQGRRDTTVGPLDAIRRKSDVPPPLPEEDSEQSTGFTSNSTQPETKTTKSDQINFENKISDQQPTARDPVTHHIEDAKHKAPYQDVTASPTTPSNNNTFHFEDKVSQGEKSSH